MSYGNYAPFYRGGYFNPMQAPIMAPISDNQNQFTQQQPYQAQTQQPMQPTSMSATNQNNDIIWVQGEAGAKAYLVAPNNTVTLWDSESSTIYVKTADMNGVPSMRILDFTERSQGNNKTNEKHDCQCGNKFADKKEVTELQEKYDEFSKKLIDLEKKMESFSEKQNDKKAEEK